MVVPLKLVKFYGSKLPRPRIYANTKFSTTRVDPPISINDALLQWAKDAHWSMGGLASKRRRMQGKIEGSIRRLRAEKERYSRRRKSIEGEKENDVSSHDTTPEESPVQPKGKNRQDVGEVTPEEKEEVPKFVPETREESLARYPRRSGKATAPEASSPVLQRSEATASKSLATRKAKDTSPPKKGVVRRVLLKEDSSDSDDGLEAFLKARNRPVRRSSRLQSTPKASEAASFSSDSDSE